MPEIRPTTIRQIPSLNFGLPTIATTGVRVEVVVRMRADGAYIDDIAQALGILPLQVEAALSWHKKNERRKAKGKAK